MKLQNRLPRDREFYRELRALAIPIGLQNLLAALTGATDALMLGRLTQDAVAAVSLANQIAFIMSLFQFAVVGAGGALLAQYWGKGDMRMVKNLFSLVLKRAGELSLVFFGLAMAFPRQLIGIFTPDEALIEIGASYLRIVSFSYFFTSLTQVYFTVMKLEGRAARSVVISVAALVTDMVLDYFLIYGGPRLGPDGSAYSTVGVEAVALVWCIAESYRPGASRPDWEGMRWRSPEVNRDIWNLAVPMLGSGLAWGISISMHSFLMGHFGSDATAAASISNTALELVTCVCKGISAGSGIMIGKLLGQDLFEKAKEYGRRFWSISVWTGFIHMALLALLAPLAVRFFVLTDTARHYLVLMLGFTALYVFAYSLNTIMVCGVFPAGGDAKYDAVSVFFATWCFAIPLAVLGAFVFHWPVFAVYVVMCADEIVKTPWIMPRYRKYIWLRNLTREG